MWTANLVLARDSLGPGARSTSTSARATPAKTRAPVLMSVAATAVSVCQVRVFLSKKNVN